MTTKPGLKSILKFEGLEEEVANKIFKEQMSYRDICKLLKEKYNIEITEGSISNFKKYIVKQTKEFLEQDKDQREKINKILLDTGELLVNVKEKLVSKMEQFDADPKQWKQQIAYISLLLTEIHMLLKRSGEIRPTQIIEKQEINNIQINNMVQVELVRLIDEGKIPIEACAPEIKEFYQKMKRNANFS